jgi:hypothetical protein
MMLNFQDASAQTEEPSSMVGQQGKVIEEYVYLKEERAKQQYDEGSPHEYDTGIHLIGIGEIDKTEGVYELDFWFWISINEEDDPTDFTVTKPEFDFINAKHLEFSAGVTTPHYYETRVQGEFRNLMEFHDFPFEQLNLRIIAEPISPFTTDEVVFVLDPESIVDPDAFVPGFEIRQYEIKEEDFTYTDDETYSRFIANFVVDRNVSGSFFKNVFPVTLIASLSLIIFWIPQIFTPRIYLTAPLLLSLVYLHRAVVGDIPSVGYMTIFDKIMTIYYVLFLNSIVSLGIQMRYNIQYKNNVKAEKVNRIMRYFIPVIIGVGLLFVFF